MVTFPLSLFKNGYVYQFTFTIAPGKGIFFLPSQWEPGAAPGGKPQESVGPSHRDSQSFSLSS